VKKRGRPRKTDGPAMAAKAKAAAAAGATAAVVADTAPVLKRKRGRPPKNPKPTDSAEPKPAPRRGRGRPPKNPDAVALPKSMPVRSKPGAPPKSTADAESAPQPPKKRGRPPKKTPAASKAEKGAVQGAKRPGRPRKTALPPSSTGAVQGAKPPGRPRKATLPTSPAESKRKMGKPHKMLASQKANKDGVKRGPGRPRKNPAVTPTPKPEVSEQTSKPKRGRPSKKRKLENIGTNEVSPTSGPDPNPLLHDMQDIVTLFPGAINDYSAPFYY